VHQVKINVVHLEFFQGGIKGWLDILWSVFVVPELGCKEDLRSRDATVLDGLADVLLSSIDSSRIDVSDAFLECVCCGIILGVLVLPCSG
jgi:hypothetical protein